MAGFNWDRLKKDKQIEQYRRDQEENAPLRTGSSGGRVVAKGGGLSKAARLYVKAKAAEEMRLEAKRSRRRKGKAASAGGSAKSKQKATGIGKAREQLAAKYVRRMLTALAHGKLFQMPGPITERITAMGFRRWVGDLQSREDLLSEVARKTGVELETLRARACLVFPGPR